MPNCLACNDPCVMASRGLCRKCKSRHDKLVKSGKTTDAAETAAGRILKPKDTAAALWRFTHGGKPKA